MRAINSTPAIAAVQFLPDADLGRIWHLIERRARRNPRFRDRLDAAKTRAKADSEAYDAWLCQQAADREAAKMEDVPW